MPYPRESGAFGAFDSRGPHDECGQYVGCRYRRAVTPGMNPGYNSTLVTGRPT
jgi:hypothetical protein